mmetsp:Transcript_3973/g.11530  ORF Transcript_3973/g.11530 Transcript_3973/m.11530 type:complete len:213 (+) Transcript_3973:153-791(+)
MTRVHAHAFGRTYALVAGPNCAWSSESGSQGPWPDKVRDRAGLHWNLKHPLQDTKAPREEPHLVVRRTSIPRLRSRSSWRMNGGGFLSGWLVSYAAGARHSTRNASSNVCGNVAHSSMPSDCAAQATAESFTFSVVMTMCDGWSFSRANRLVQNSTGSSKKRSSSSMPSRALWPIPGTLSKACTAGEQSKKRMRRTPVPWTCEKNGVAWQRV